MQESTLFKSVFNVTPVIMGVFASDGTLRYYNESLKRVSGYSDGELKNLHIREMIHPDDYEWSEKNYTALINGEIDNLRSTRRFLCKHGDVFWADVSSKAICNAHGDVEAVTCTAFDMTRRKNMEVALRDRHEGLEALFEKQGDAVVVLDEGMTIIRVNRIFEKISGYSWNEMTTRRHLSEFIHRDDLEMLRGYHGKRRIASEVVPEAYVCRLIYSTGMVCRHKVRVSLIPGTGRSLVSIGDCVTQEPLEVVADAAGNRDETFRLIAENSTDVVFITNLDLAVTYVSPSVERLTGYSQEEFKILKLQEFFSGDSYAKARKMLKAGILGQVNDPGPYVTEYQCTHKDGTSRWIETIVTMILSEYGHPVGITGASRDISERKMAEEALRRSETKYRMLTEEIKDVVFGLTPDLRIDYISPVVSQFSGYIPGEMTGSHISKFVVRAEELGVAINLLEQSFQGNIESTTYDFFFSAKARPNFYVEVSCNPIYEGDKVILLQCVARDISERKKAEDALKKREQELSVENSYLKKSIQKSERFGNIIGKSEVMQRVYERIIQAASSSANVVVSGPSGTGKELVAQAIHEMSPRSDKPFVPVNCGAIPEAIIESEFFGYKKGAFTGAVYDKAGFLDLAEGGTLFLDEVGEIGLNMQVKLLRALEGGGYTPIGSNRVKHGEFSIVAATNRDLMALVQQKKIREDFFFRIHVIPIKLPPLKDRAEDIPLLMDHFLMQSSKNKPLPHIPHKIRKAFMAYSWPGNVRELQNVLNRYLVLNKVDFNEMPGDMSHPVAHPKGFGGEEEGKDSDPLAMQVEQFEKGIIRAHLNRLRWNRTRVAQVLNIDRKTLASKIKRYSLSMADK